MPCAVSCARPNGLATIASIPSPRSRSPSPRACSQPRSDRRSASCGLGLHRAVGDVGHGLAVAGEVDDHAERRREEELVDAGLARDLRVEGDHEHVVLAGGDGMPVDLGEDLDRVAVLGQPRRADEHRAHRRAVDPRDVEVLLERADLAAERVAHAQRVHAAEVLAVEHDHPGARAEHGLAGARRTPAAGRRDPRA